MNNKNMSKNNFRINYSNRIRNVISNNMHRFIVHPVKQIKICIKANFIHKVKISGKYIWARKKFSVLKMHTIVQSEQAATIPFHNYIVRRTIR